MIALVRAQRGACGHAGRPVHGTARVVLRNVQCFSRNCNGFQVSQMRRNSKSQCHVCVRVI